MITPEAVEELIHRRSSSLSIDRERPVDDSLIDRLAAVAQAAPNHGKTRPLRIAAVRGDARLALGNAIGDAMAARGDAENRVEKARIKYSRAPLVLVVASAAGEDDHETRENEYSVAAGMQNALLLLESMGLISLWSSPNEGCNDAITSFCRFAPTDHVVGIFYVGWPQRELPRKERPAPVVVRLGE